MPPRKGNKILICLQSLVEFLKILDAFSHLPEDEHVARLELENRRNLLLFEEFVPANYKLAQPVLNSLLHRDRDVHALSSPPTEEEKKNMNMGMIMGMAFVKTAVMVILTAYVVMIINYRGDMMTALKIGAVLGGIASFPTGINYLFLKKPFSIWMLDGGYHACGVIITSIILSVWR